jgi:hypothetical protein
MFRQAGMICAGVLLGAAAGCSFDAFLVSMPGPIGKQRTVPGTIDQVSANLQTALGAAGIQVTTKPQGKNVRLEGVTQTGKKFALVLHQQYSPGPAWGAPAGSQHTLLTVEWDDGADLEFWGMVMQVVAPSKDAHGFALPVPQQQGTTEETGS